jgi:hypothetical protein
VSCVEATRQPEESAAVVNIASGDAHPIDPKTGERYEPIEIPILKRATWEELLRSAARPAPIESLHGPIASQTLITELAK